MSRAPEAEVSGNEQVIRDFREGKEQLNGIFPRSTVLLLTTIGARTGRPRVWPVVNFVVGDRLVITATAAGRENHPAWYYNLFVNPRVGVERWVDDTLESFEAVATPTSAQERERLWAGVVELEPRWSTYQAMTERIIPVITLDRT